jgi:Zn finger protein HypA/HybF involved in hydrogenase expression
MKENTIKISEPKLPCMCPQHEPPTMKVFDAGTYQHTCPKCGEVTIFEVPLITL